VNGDGDGGKSWRVALGKKGGEKSIRRMLRNYIYR
jgi:hypothetical protein